MNNDTGKKLYLRILEPNGGQSFLEEPHKVDWGALFDCNCKNGCDDCPTEDNYEVSHVWLTQQEYESLPEFEGF